MKKRQQASFNSGNHQKVSLLKCSVVIHAICMDEYPLHIECEQIGIRLKPRLKQTDEANSITYSMSEKGFSCSTLSSFSSGCQYWMNLRY